MNLHPRASQTTPQKRSSPGFFWALALFFCAFWTADAGELRIAWDAVPGAAGYYVDYGRDSSNLNQRYDAGNQTQATIPGLTDCSNWHFAVSAYDTQRQAAQSSDQIYSWPRPEIATPSSILTRQGDVFTLDLTGANFRDVVELTIDNPNVALQNVVRFDCHRMQAAVAVGPAGPGDRPAEIGIFRLRAINPGGIQNRLGGFFTIDIDPARFDLDRSTQATMDRIDGSDLSLLAFNWGGCDDPALTTCDHGDAARYLPDLDLDGNGWIDGEDLSYIAMQRWGRCWSPQTGDWTDGPIVHPSLGLICPTVAP